MSLAPVLYLQTPAGVQYGCVYLTCMCVRCLRQASLRVCVARSEPLPFIRWRPRERDYGERNKPAEVRGAGQKKPHIIREGRTERMGGGRGGLTEAGDQFLIELMQYKLMFLTSTFRGK